MPVGALVCFILAVAAGVAGALLAGDVTAKVDFIFARRYLSMGLLFAALFTAAGIWFMRMAREDSKPPRTMTLGLGDDEPPPPSPPRPPLEQVKPTLPSGITNQRLRRMSYNRLHPRRLSGGVIAAIVIVLVTIYVLGALFDLGAILFCPWLIDC